MNHILNDFSSAFRQHGINSPDRILADGQIHRFRSGPEREQNGYYRLTILPAHKGGEIGFGTIGCWKRGFQEKWSSHQPGEISQVDWAAIERARSERKRIEAEEAVAAIGRGKEIWAKCREPDARHPYLVAKAIAHLGIRQNYEAIDMRYENSDGEQRQFVPKDSLVVPIFRNGGLVSLQFIAPDGTKRFLKGGHVEGGYASIGAKGSEKSRILIAEGYATGASLHAATGLPVVVCFNCGNLLNVGKTIRSKYPDAEIIIAGDNDQYC